MAGCNLSLQPSKEPLTANVLENRHDTLLRQETCCLLSVESDCCKLCGRNPATGSMAPKAIAASMLVRFSNFNFSNFKSLHWPECQVPVAGHNQDSLNLETISAGTWKAERDTCPMVRFSSGGWGKENRQYSSCLFFQNSRRMAEQQCSVREHSNANQSDREEQNRSELHAGQSLPEKRIHGRHVRRWRP